MITVNVIGLTLLVASLMLLAFLGGWEISVHRWYSRQLDLAAKNKSLQEAVNKLAERMDTDEMRTAIDLGKEAVLMDITDLVTETQQNIKEHRQ